MSWLSLLLVDIIYALQFILFIQWYYPKVIIVTGYTTSFILFEHLIAISELVTCYLLTVYNVRKALKE